MLSSRVGGSFGRARIVWRELLLSCPRRDGGREAVRRIGELVPRWEVLVPRRMGELGPRRGVLVPRIGELEPLPAVHELSPEVPESPVL